MHKRRSGEVWACKRTCLRLVKGKVTTQRIGIFPQLCWQSLSAREGIFYLLLPKIRLPLLCLQRLGVDVLAAFPCLPADLQ